MKQIYVVHGGDFFDTRKEFLESIKKSKVEKDDFLFDAAGGWKENLARELGKECEVFYPKMPNKYDAKYEEWKAWFEKSLKFLDDGVILVGHSLGGIFLVRYLSENEFPVKIKSLLLVATPYFKRKKSQRENAGFNFKSIGKLAEQVENIVIYHSKDDPIVNFSHGKKFKKDMPGAKFYEFEDRHHFVGENLPELVREIKNTR